MRNYNNLPPKFCRENFVPVALNLIKISLSMVLNKNKQ